MSHEITPLEQIRRTNPAGNEFWSSRDFAKILGYADYRNYQSVIESILAALPSRTIAAWIRQTQHRVVYAAPGIHSEPASALAELVSRLPHVSITISPDLLAIIKQEGRV